MSDSLVLSCDIGIRNLALCIMSAQDKTDLLTYKMHLWNVFDTLETDEHLCLSLQKSGKVCNKKCQYKYTNAKKVVQYTCKTHFPKTLTIEKSNHFKIKMIKEYLLQDIANIVLKKVQEIYDTTPIFRKLSNIVIELQPKINSNMKFISHIIYGKFVELMRDTKCKIRFVRASQKLKAYTGPEIECKLKGAYAKRKWLSIQYTKWFLENKLCKEEKEKWLSFFNSKTVQPDMGDTFLMAINSLYGIPKKQKMNFKKTNI